MGRQLGVYFTKEDCQNFLDFAKTTGNVVALPWKSPTSDFAPIETVDDKNLGFFLFNRGISSNLVIRHVAQQSYYAIDSLQSSVIEFSGSSIRDRTMFPGRIWAEFTFLNKERTALLPKEPEFSKWYDILANWIRNTLNEWFGLIRFNARSRSLGMQVKVRKNSTIREEDFPSTRRVRSNPKSSLEEFSIMEMSPTPPTFMTLHDEDLLDPKNESN